MTDELLPPDPTKDGWYWVKQSDVGPDAWEWSSRDQKWAVAAWTVTPEEAARIGILASPHPIPGPEQLDALHALPDELANDIAITRKLRDLYTLQGAGWRRQETIAAIYERCAAMLRAALGIKP